MEQTFEVWQVAFEYVRTLSDRQVIAVPKGLTEHDRAMFVRGYLNSIYGINFNESLRLTITEVTDEFET